MLVLGGEFRDVGPRLLRDALFDLERTRERDLVVDVVPVVSVSVLKVAEDATLSVSEDGPYLSCPRDRALLDSARPSGVACRGSLLASRRGLPPVVRLRLLLRLALRDSRRRVDPAISAGPRLRLRLRVSVALRIDRSICAPVDSSRGTVGPLSRSCTPLAPCSPCCDLERPSLLERGCSTLPCSDSESSVSNALRTSVRPYRCDASPCELGRYRPCVLAAERPVHPPWESL